MLRVCRLHLALATGGAITHAATTLNKLLDVSQRDEPVPHDKLKAFLKTSVMPVMAGTELDRRGNSMELRQYLGQLTRDAAFAAVIVSARPDAGFVRCITTCIKEDHQRMRFVSKMTSAQASKTVEYLCKVGVKDEVVFPVLLSRLDYSNLRELARVMLALTESGLHELNMQVVVPLYCGNKWEVDVKESSASTISSSGLPAASGAGKPPQSCNVFEAVRVLRALSKSCRRCVEARRHAPSHSLGELPRDSLNLLRNNLLAFIFENGALLRGAHWVNLARALVYFPVECGELRHLAAACPLFEQEIRTARLEDGTQATVDEALDRPITCEAVAEAAIRHVFDYAEHRRALPSGTTESNLSADFPFDLTYFDLVKLLPMLEQSARSKAALQTASGGTPEADTRVAIVLRVISANVQHLYLPDLVKVLQSVRHLPPSAEASATVDAVVAQAGARLVEHPPAEFLQKVSFYTIIQFAVSISALRVTRCDDFVNFVIAGASYFPRTLTAETTLSFANALANVASNRSEMCHEAMRTLLARLMSNYKEELQTCPLVSRHPHAVTKILRACVLLDYIPERRLLERFLGSVEVPLQITPEISNAGGALVFGLTRTMANFLRQARTESPGRVEELWSQGVLGALLPMALACTKNAAAQVAATGWGESAAAYMAVSWRSTLEMVTAFVDPLLAHNTPEETARRMVEAFPFCAELLSTAAVMTHSQIDSLAEDASSASDLRHRLQRVSFNSNCPVHFLSSLLILEYLVYQSVSQMSSTKAACVAEDVKLRVTSLKDTAYARFLTTAAQEGMANAPMEVVRYIFDCPVPASAGSASKAVLLNRRNALEITTNLPFALSLIMNPGPVNEYFTERCMSLMVAEDDA